MAASSIPFAFVDVFTDIPLTGNPLAVVPYAPGLDDDVCRQLAREFNQIETTFLLPPTLPGADWLLRSFTTIGVEVFGAGHNALGAWWWLAQSGQLQLTEATLQFHQQLGDRVLPLTIRSVAGRPVSIGMVQSAPTYGATVSDRAALAKALGLQPQDVLPCSLPAQVVATDVAHLLVPVEREERSACDDITRVTKDRP